VRGTQGGAKGATGAHPGASLVGDSNVGKPIPSHLAHHERLTKVTGLAVLSSDPILADRSERRDAPNVIHFPRRP
jgi:hypothetical protein